MLDLKNIILVFIILFLLNKVTCKTNKHKSVIEKMTNDIYKPAIYRLEQEKYKQDQKPVITQNVNFIYGDDQYITKNIDISNNKYQNLNILRPNNNLELTSNLKFNYDQNNNAHNNKLNIRHKYDNRNLTQKLDDLNVTNQPLTKEQIINNYNKENTTGLITIPLNNIVDQEEASSQRMLYDYRFLDMNNQDLKNDNMFTGKTIKEVYDSLILDFKKINQKKIPKTIQNNLVEGAFGETSVAVDQWYYEDEKNELSYDPNQNLELAVDYVIDPDDIY